MKRNLILITSDQLSLGISSLQNFDLNRDLVLMCELKDEATYVPHHRKKLVFIFSSMRHFAKELKDKGFEIRYTKLDDPKNAGSFLGELRRSIKDCNPAKIIVTEPGEFRLITEINNWEKKLNKRIEIRDDDRFLASHREFNSWAKGRKQFRMEFFYREMRRKYDVLMNGDSPDGGHWNYDAENRKTLNANTIIPSPYIEKPDKITCRVMKLVADNFPENFGDIEPFHFAVTRRGAAKALKKFIKQRLISFGDYQDAMIEGKPWVFHSHIGLYINAGLLSPMECIAGAEKAYKLGEAPLNAVEGFIRQILGWREFIRGIYWLHMPHYKNANHLNAKRRLPDFFWHGDSKMNCIHQCIKETKINAYAHHIQRLMVLGNFALLTSIDPKHMHEWYLSVYIDAYEWVEVPNVTGMALYADGGVLASKPYAASATYIDKMSNYCKSCDYNSKAKTGKNACPFNYLYWNFLITNEDKLRNNPQMSLSYTTLGRMDDQKLDRIKHDSQVFLRAIENHELV